MTLVVRVEAVLAACRLGPGPLLIAVSGGADSMTLLDILPRLPSLADHRLIVAHVDHGIHPESALVADRVRTAAQERGLLCISTALALGPDTSETVARRARLTWLRTVAREQGARWIVLAHHADDQHETTLMRFLRGSGPAGLAGMRVRAGVLLRPLLGIRRATLRRYAAGRGLTWWEDPANTDRRHLRSWLRHAVLPLLEARLPDLSARLDQGRRQAASNRRAWAAALRAWPGLSFGPAQGGWSVDWGVLQQLPDSLALSLAQALVRRARGPAGRERIVHALASLAAAQSGASADLGRGWRFELAFGRLLVLAPRHSPSAPGSTAGAGVNTLDGAAGQTTWGRWDVRWVTETAPSVQPRDGHTAWFIPAALSLRAWRPGDRLAPLGGIGQRLAVRCFQEARVARSFRLDWPMIEGSGELAWIPGVCRSDRFLPRAGEVAVRIDVERSR